MPKRNVELNLGVDLDNMSKGFTTALRMGKKFSYKFDRIVRKMDMGVDVKKFERDLDQMVLEYKKSIGQMDRANDKLKKGGQGTNKTLGGMKSMSLGAKAGILGLSAAITGAFVMAAKKAVSVGSDFTATMSNLEAISEATGEEMEMLEATAEKFGKTTKFTATQVGELQVNFSKLGFKPDEINSVTGATLALAAATGEDLASAAEVAGGTVRAFGYEAASTSRVTDVMTSSFSNSALNLQKYKVAIGQAGKVSADAGFQIEDTASVLGVLADNNIRAETTGTGVRNMILKLNQEGSKVAEILGGGVNSFDDFIERLKAARDDTDVFKKAQKELGVENAVVFSTLVGNIEKLQEKSKLYYQSTGTAQKKMQTQMDNLRGDSQQLTSAMEGLALTLFDEVEPSLRGATQGITDFFLKLQESTLETAVRQLKEMGVEAEKLKHLEYGVAIESDLETIQNSSEEINKIFKNIGRSIQDVDVAKQITGLESMREIQKGNLDINNLNKEAIKDRLEAIREEAKQISNLGYKGVKNNEDTLQYLINQEVELRKLLQHINNYEGAYKSLNDNQEKYNKEVKKGKDVFDEMADIANDIEPFNFKFDDSDIEPFKNEMVSLLDGIEIEPDVVLDPVAIQDQINSAVGKIKNIELDFTPTDVDLSTSIGFFDGLKLGFKALKTESDDYIDGLKTAMVAGAEEMQSYTNTAMDLASSLYDFQMTKIDNWKNKKFDAEQEAYEKELERINNSQMSEEQKYQAIEKLETEHQAKMESIENKAREKEIAAKKAMKPIKVAQAISNTALGITKAFPNPWLMGMVAATGAAQVATIQAQEYKSGGYTGEGSPSDEAGIVHKKEFVFNEPATSVIGKENLYTAMRNPVMAKTALQGITSPVGGLSQKPKFAFAGGGYTGNIGGSGIFDDVKSKLSVIAKELSALNSKSNNPIIADFRVTNEELAILIRKGEDTLSSRELNAD